jgi:phosphoribosylglycinamide formyltransferase-1
MPKHSLSQPLRLGFLASHGGSSMRAIIAAAMAGDLAADARLVISNNAESAALDWARREGLAWRHISGRTEGSVEAADQAMANALVESGAELIVLSGYMRRIGPAMLAAFPARILNIHPALLPAFGGQGMYGRFVHEAVVAAGATASGATVHVVDDEYDHGPIIAQARVELPVGASIEAVESAVRAVEPGLYTDTLRRIAEGLLRLP